jgi:hypothetical protein
MKKKLASGIVLAAATIFITGTANASPLYNTGVDVSGGVDLAWSIVGSIPSPPLTSSSNPMLSYPSNVYPDTSPGFPIPPWVPNSLISSWDTPFPPPPNSNTDPSMNGSYIYQETFTSTGAFTLFGQFAADNEVAAIILNGTQIYTGPIDGSSQFTFWTIFSGLTQVGTNTIDFDVVNYAQNGGNPSGLDVQFQRDNRVGNTPLPSTWTMLIAGFVGLFGFVAFGGKKRNAAATAVA